MFKKILFTFLIAIFSTFGISQAVYASTLDSLKTQLPRLRDHQKVETYLDIAQYFFEQNNDLDSMLLYSNMAYNIAAKVQYVPGVIRSLSYSGIAYSRLGNIKQSNENWSKALRIAKLVKDDKNIADLEGKIGYNFHVVADYKNAIEHYLKAAESMEKLRDFGGLSTTYSNIAMVFNTLKQDEQCLLYIRKSIAQLPKVDDEYVKVIAYSGAMNEMLDIGLNEPTYLDSALQYANLGLSIAIKNDYRQRIALFYTQLSEIFDLKGNRVLADKYFGNAKEYRSYLSKNLLLTYYFRAIRFYKSNNENILALDYIDSSLVKMEDIGNDYYSFRIYQESYEVNKLLGNFSKALSDYENSKTYEARLLDEDRNNQITQIQQRFNKVQNEKTISELNQEKLIYQKNEQIDNLKINLLTISAILLAALLALIFFIYKQRVNKQNRKLMEVELRLNRSRMNPHFFFNALTSIQTLSLQEKNFKDVPFYISKFSKVMRLSLESTYTEMIVLEEEIDFIKQYLDVQQLYLDDRFKYTITVDDKILTSEYKIPPMLLQPFLENSIEHGFKNMREVGIIEINFTIIETELCIIIKDNGAGFKNDDKHKLHPSRAMQIIKDRLYLFNQRNKSSAAYNMVNLPESKGVVVTIHLPLIHLK